jgi:cytochrome P450
VTPLSRGRALEDLTDLVLLPEVNQSPDPQAVYDRLRKQWGEIAPVELEPGVPAWLVMGYREIIQVARNDRLFSRSAADWRYFDTLQNPESTLAALMTPRDHAYYANGEEHRRLRAPLDDGLSALDEHRMSREIQAICRELIATFAHRGEADLVADYAILVPMLSVARWFGIGTEEGHRLTEAVLWAFSAGPQSQKGVEIIIEILTNLMQSHKDDPADDLTTSFLRHDDLRNDIEVAFSIILVIMAGYQATIAWIAQTLRLILTDPRFGSRLRGGRLGLDDALDEVLWRQSPAANMVGGYALAETDIAGQRIRKGDAVFLCYAAANTDPRVHSDDPWLAVGNRAHLSFGTGPHVCPAQRPSRIIARVGVESVLTRLHDLKLAVPADEITNLHSIWALSPESLPVRFTGFS